MVARSADDPRLPKGKLFLLAESEFGVVCVPYLAVPVVRYRKT